MLERLDWGVGQILTALDEQRLAQRTLVIFSSDNGGDPPLASNRPLRGWKAQLYEGGIRVPCLFRWPGRLPAGKVLNFPIITMDLTTTILSATGTRRSPRALPPDGIDLLPFMGSKSVLPSRRFFWLAQPPGEGAPMWRAARDGDWKMVQIGERRELYDLAQDPSEKIDLARQEPRKLEQLAELYAAWEASLPAKAEREARRRARQSG
jgi:arylsulfatase A-like enzyme